MIYYTVRPGDTLKSLSVRFHIPVRSLLSANPGLQQPYRIPVGQQLRIPVESIRTAHNPPGAAAPYISANELGLRNTLRELWEEHVAWTRLTILSAASDSPDLNATIARLLRNASDMAAALRPIYGETDAVKFGRLIHDHLSIALQLVEAAKQGNTQAALEAEKQWYANADQIAGFLNSINPYIDRAAFQNMLYTHLALTKEEAVERLNHAYEKDIAAYDQIEAEALRMADLMSDGIVKQFPRSFRQMR